MSNRWVNAPYHFKGAIYGTRTNEVNAAGEQHYMFERFLVDEHGQPLCSVQQDEARECYFLNTWVRNNPGFRRLHERLQANTQHGGFKHFDEAVRWCEQNDWSQSMPENTDSNGVQQTKVRPNERQHCPACNTDGEHSFECVPLATASGKKEEHYKCATCGDIHARTPVKKRGSTIEENKAIMANQPQLAHERMVSQITSPAPSAVTPVLDVAGNGASTFAKTRAEEPIDEIERPQHYNFSKLEVIDVIEAWGLGFHLGNTIKYIARAPHKGTELSCLKKSRWYLNRRIAELERAEKEAEQAVQQ